MNWRERLFFGQSTVEEEDQESHKTPLWSITCACGLVEADLGQLREEAQEGRGNEEFYWSNM